MWTISSLPSQETRLGSKRLVSGLHTTSVNFSWNSHGNPEGFSLVLPYETLTFHSNGVCEKGCPLFFMPFSFPSFSCIFMKFSRHKIFIHSSVFLHEIHGEIMGDFMSPLKVHVVVFSWVSSVHICCLMLFLLFFSCLWLQLM